MNQLVYSISNFAFFIQTKTGSTAGVPVDNQQSTSGQMTELILYFLLTMLAIGVAILFLKWVKEKLFDKNAAQRIFMQNIDEKNFEDLKEKGKITPEEYKKIQLVIAKKITAYKDKGKDQEISDTDKKVQEILDKMDIKDATK